VFQILASHNDDLLRLRDKGYAVSVDSNYLIVRDIPHLGAGQQLLTGAIVTKLVFVDQVKVIQDDHQIFFAGGVPHNVDGSPIRNLGGGPTALQLSAASKDVVVQRSFSNKPRATGKFENFFDKIESYVAIISGPAMELHDVSPLTFRSPPDAPADPIFKVHDTMTSRAEIGELSGRFRDDVVAIVGLGGTGAYVLDFLAKTPVKEIRAFDLDDYHVHNAYRSPGRLELSELGKNKAEVYAARYENFRMGLDFRTRYIDETAGEEFDDVTFAFVCVDKGPARAKIFDLLISKGIPFIDVGMGLNRKRGALNGMVRTTYFPPEHAAAIRAKGLAEESEGAEGLYKANIQIGELNALNACFAVMRFKQLRGFYFEENPMFHYLFEIGDFKIQGLGDDDL